jgi:hypothetical protein
MAKSRVIPSLGPTPLAVTNTTGVKTGSWLEVGPFNAGLFGAQITFGTATSGAIGKVQACVTTAATGGITTLISQTGNNSGAYKFSTYTTVVFSFLRVYSSAKGSTSVSSNTVTAYFNALR